MANDASALGEAIGKQFETAIVDGLKPTVARHGCTIKPARLRNGTGNVYQIDAVIFDADERPLALIDPKYIRYTKHNRDKGSWLCVAHYNLRKTHLSLRKSIAILAGRWSKPSIALIRSFGVEVFQLHFDTMVEVLRDYGVDFEWREGDRETPRLALERYRQLSEKERSALGKQLAGSVLPDVSEAVDTVLGLDVDSIPQRVTEVEVLLKTNLNEMKLISRPTIAEAIGELASLVQDRTNVLGSTD